ncbi:hypothetical protein EOD42_13900 [Rhodovarius crocodyli]|uniref:Uncharacterized protein n=1 Tax=Rhodovarius crocodyli TaxID=1979269 RepID=A0A437MF13_9PROT|nr:hypothetical protein [Rhodovarius crocodyli]RVT96205.1 hypothetical protein EOD42_13900 [Rhodovarius crocodyli]
MQPNEALIRAVAKAACPGREPCKDDLWQAEIYIRALAEVSPEVRMVLSDRDEDQAFIIRHADPDCPDIVFSGCGAREGAYRRYARRLAAWNCDLFQLICGSQHKDEVRRRILQESRRAQQEGPRAA